MIFYTDSPQLKALINMCDNIVRMVCLRQETFCNNGGKEAWFGDFKLPITFVYGQKHKVWVLIFLEPGEHIETKIQHIRRNCQQFWNKTASSTVFHSRSAAKNVIK